MQIQSLAADNIAEKIDSIILRIDSRDRSNIILAMNICCESMFIHDTLEFRCRIDSKMIFQRLEKTYRIRGIGRICNFANVSKSSIGLSHSETRSGAIDCLRFENSISIIFLQSDNRDNCMIFERASSIENICVRIFSARRSTDEWTWQKFRFI